MNNQALQQILLDWTDGKPLDQVFDLKTIQSRSINFNNLKLLIINIHWSKSYNNKNVFGKIHPHFKLMIEL